MLRVRTIRVVNIVELLRRQVGLKRRTYLTVESLQVELITFEFNFGVNSILVSVVWIRMICSTVIAVPSSSNDCNSLNV